MGEISLFDLNGVGPLHYRVDNLHFHSRSEHKINGQQYDIELHFVHYLLNPDTERKSYSPDKSEPHY